MKLLGWMHRKFWKNSHETLKDLSIGLTPNDDQQYISGGRIDNKYLENSERATYFSRYFTGQEEDIEGDTTAAVADIFPGFLAIGTLGTESITNHPVTPRFSLSVESEDEIETEVIEDELMFIKATTEKVLEENEDEISQETSNARTGKTSQCCDISLGGKLMESAEARVTDGIASSLQTEAAKEQPRTASPVRKEHRPSLEELLWKTKQADENSEMKPKVEEKLSGKQAYNSAVHLMKKLLKRRTINPSAKSFNATSGATSESAKAKRKSIKVKKQIKRYFISKVHSEDSLYGLHDDKSGKQQNKNNETYIPEPDSIDFGPSDDDIIIYPQGVFSENNSSSEGQSDSSPITKECSDASANEFWIKTDPDYLVLELWQLEGNVNA